MSTKISRDFSFLSGIYFENKLTLSNYDIQLSMSVETDSIREQNIAMDRIKYMIHEGFCNSIFIHDSEKKVIENYLNADLKICTIPSEPYDQILTLLLLIKLNAITEGRLVINYISLTSDLSDGVTFEYDDTIFEVGIPFSDSGWWAESTSNISYIPVNPKKEKIVKLRKSHDWAILGLDWKEKTKNTTEIIFTP